MHRLPDHIGAGDIRLRRASSADAPVLFALFNNWNVVRWLALPSWPLHFQDTQDFLAAANQGPGSTQYWVIERNAVVLGGISAAFPAPERATGSDGPALGYWLGEPFWGQGIVTAAARLLCGAIFAHIPVSVVHSGVFDGNAASLRIQEKLGFRIAGRSVRRCMPQGRDLPHVDTILDRAAFRPVPV